MQQQGRNALRWLDDQGLGARFLIHDRDSKSSSRFRCARTLPPAPDANAFTEAWIGAFKQEALSHFLCFSLGHLDHIGQAYVRFFNEYRPHEELDKQTIPAAADGPPAASLSQAAPPPNGIRCQRVLGGLLRHYYRAAA